MKTERTEQAEPTADREEEKSPTERLCSQMKERMLQLVQQAEDAADALREGGSLHRAEMVRGVAIELRETMRLIDALQPFAEHADAIDEVYAWEDDWPLKTYAVGLTIGDCRRARRALREVAAMPRGEGPMRSPK